MCGQHNVRASAEDNTGQNTDNEHTPNPRTEMKIPDPAGNRARAASLEGRDSIDPVTATSFMVSISLIYKKNTVHNSILICVTLFLN